ncbi:MAG: glycosyl transferase [Flavobacterium psychrophilum]|nr:MAG: glycosyl transferase [Flavobacterium psychrophilum]
MNISVCLATYNGAKYIDLQLESILRQLGPDDEVIVLDDCSKDNTLEVVRAINDQRIKIYKNDVNKGHVFSFGHVVSLATKDIIFMSDQDDIWIDGRVELMKNSLLSSGSLLVSSNSAFIKSDGAPSDFSIDGVTSESSRKYFRNIIDIFAGKTNYYGCAMAFRKELNALVLPIPSYVESHDLWIAMGANIAKSNIHIDEATLLRRIHGENASVLKRKLLPKLWSRVVFAISAIQLFYRNLLVKK